MYFTRNINIWDVFVVVVVFAWYTKTSIGLIENAISANDQTCER